MGVLCSSLLFALAVRGEIHSRGEQMLSSVNYDHSHNNASYFWKVHNQVWFVSNEKGYHEKRQAGSLK